MATLSAIKPPTPMLRHRSWRIHITPSTLLIHLFLIGGAVLCLIPFYWMFVLTTHDSKTILGFPPPLWFGNNFAANYDKMLGIIPFWQNVVNSFVVGISYTVLTLILCSMAGYAFAMNRFPGRDTLFRLMLLTLMIPNIVGLIPWVVMMRSLGWYNTLWALIIPNTANAFGIYWMRQYILAHVPPELIDAARVDGCREIMIFWRVVAPILRPAYGALGIMSFMASWNGFFNALLVLQDKALYTLPVALSALRYYDYRALPDYGVMMMGTALATLPILLIFVLASRWFIAGLTSGAVKQ